jgi:glycosyltransferase involved in cell wall biosynthesis
MQKDFVFCHLLNDSSGSPVVLRSTIAGIDDPKRAVLYVGSHGQGVLDEVELPIQRYWYRRSRFKILTLLSYLVSQIALYSALNRARDISPNATIFVNTLLPFGAMLWGKVTGRLVIVHVHEVTLRPALLRRFLTSVAGKCAQQLIYVSKDHYRRLPIKGPPARIIANPVSLRISSQGAYHTNRRDGVFRVLMLASLRGYKGVEEFVKLAYALRHRSDICFELVLNEVESDVKMFAARHSKVTNINFHSRINDPGPFYSRAHLVLNLSRVDQFVETFGLTLIEAMAFGLPVIAPPIGGPTEIISHGVEGFFIDSRNIAALSQAVILLAEDNEKYFQMSLESRNRVKIYSLNQYFKNINIICNLSGIKNSEMSNI